MKPEHFAPDGAKEAGASRIGHGAKIARTFRTGHGAKIAGASCTILSSPALHLLRSFRLHTSRQVYSTIKGRDRDSSFSPFI